MHFEPFSGEKLFRHAILRYYIYNKYLYPAYISRISNIHLTKEAPDHDTGLRAVIQAAQGRDFLDKERRIHYDQIHWAGRNLAERNQAERIPPDSFRRFQFRKVNLPPQPMNGKPGKETMRIRFCFP